MALFNFKKAPSEEKSKKVFSKPLKISLIVAAVLIVVGYAGTFVWAKTYENRIAPNVWIGQIKIGGLDSDEAKQVINTAVDKIISDGTQLSVDSKLGIVPLLPLGNESSDYVVFDVNRATEEALQTHRSDLPVFQPFKILYAAAVKTKISIPVVINQDKLTTAVTGVFPDSIKPAVDAGFNFDFLGPKQDDTKWTATVTPAITGLTIPTEQFFSQLQKLLSNLDPQPIVLTRIVENPKITDSDASKLITAAENAINSAPYTVSYNNQTWDVSDEDLAQALEPAFDENKKLSLIVSADGLKAFFDTIAATTEKPATDAKLIMENDRVTNFQASSNGIAIDREKTTTALSLIIQQPENKTDCPLAVNITEPAIKMESVNSLGIKEVLGVGTSSFKGSPTNRIKNIRNGVNLLNGLLIKPGEEFSLLNALKPFDQANGYLPELVIKGDKIEPEIGGGLCQIGTTTFRAAMNSGLTITSRQNHSLVISYYNDPGNGNPGTDATIYDPAPDFKFINDTGNYLLFQAEMDDATSGLKFSFWGTSDGRKGSYVPPTLIRWIGVGETQNIETTNLEPGTEKCQSAHVGADATFTYTVEKADGTKTETVFDSHYRPLPKICLVGVEELTPVSEETSTTQDTTPTATDGSTPTTDEPAATDTTTN